MCRFECRSDGSYVQIEHVSLEPVSGDVDDDHYGGPVSSTYSLLKYQILLQAGLALSVPYWCFQTSCLLYIFVLQVFSELDDKVQAQFNNYLAERQVNNEVGEYLLALVQDKEQREYMAWLDRVSSFVGE